MAPSKRTMKKLFSIVAVFVLLGLTGSATPASADTERVSRTIGIDAGGMLTLKSFSGRITITGSDRTDVSIEGTRSGTREALDRHKLEIDGDRSHVRIVETSQERSERRDDRDQRDQMVETEFTIQVPRRLNLDIDLFSSALEVREIEGNSHRQDFLVAGASRKRQRLDPSEELQRILRSPADELARSGSHRRRDIQRAHRAPLAGLRSRIHRLRVVQRQARIDGADCGLDHQRETDDGQNRLVERGRRHCASEDLQRERDREPLTRTRSRSCTRRPDTRIPSATSSDRLSSSWPP